MKIRILTKDGDALAVKDRIAAEVETQWDTQPSKDTVVMFDRAGFGSVADIMSRTCPVFGAGSLQDGLELNVKFGKEIAQTNGISTKEVQGPKMSVDAFYIDGIQRGIMLSSVMDKGNAICRIWKSKEPKIYRLTLAKIKDFVTRFRYTGPLSCECIIEGKMPHFVRWVTHLQPHILWVIGPWLGVAIGIEERNSQRIPYDWMGIVKLSDQPCYLSAEHKDLKTLIKLLRESVDRVSIPDKSFDDNLDGIERDIEKLREWKYL